MGSTQTSFNQTQSSIKEVSASKPKRVATAKKPSN